MTDEDRCTLLFENKFDSHCSVDAFETAAVTVLSSSVVDISFKM